MRILLVEDGPAEQEAFAAAFRAAGHGVDCAASADRALALLAAGRYDAAAVDLVLVVSTGDVVAAAAARAGVRVVLMSAASLESLEDVRETVTAAGAPGFAVLQKPVTAERLLAELGGTP